MTRKKKRLEYPEIEIKNENIIKLILQSDKSLWTVAKENNTTVEEIEALIDEYHDSLDLKLEQDKQKRNDGKKLFQEIGIGLKKLRESIQNIPVDDTPKKSYVQVNIGGEWVDEPPKLLGSTSIVKVIKKKLKLNIDVLVVINHKIPLFWIKQNTMENMHLDAVYVDIIII